MEMMIPPLVLDVELNFDYDFNDPLNARSDDNEISNNTDIKLECFSGTMNTRRIKYNKIVISCVFFLKQTRPIQQIHGNNDSNSSSHSNNNNCDGERRMALSTS